MSETLEVSAEVRAMIERLIAFDTTSRNSNLDLIHDVRDYLKGLGASEIVERAELSGPVKPIAKERWAGGVDVAGSTMLANLLSTTRYGGAVAACGLAGGPDSGTGPPGRFRRPASPPRRPPRRPCAARGGPGTSSP